MFKQVEVLKNFTYYAMIMSPRIQLVSYRGQEIVNVIFDALVQGDGDRLMPEDYKALYAGMEDNSQQQKRIICDFIAGMTDRYAIQFYNRLKSSNPELIYSPV